jgi:zinc D-Ala-D-Ala carboxypeptidase
VIGYFVAGLIVVYALTRRTVDPGMKLGRYFTLREFTRTSTGLPNVPTHAAIDNLERLVDKVLDPLRASLGRPVRVTSGYRTAAINAAIGGSPTSDHVRGMAADIAVSGLTSVDVAREINRLGLPFDQLIAYAPERGGHVHVSLRPSRNRREALFAPPGGGFLPARFGSGE